MRNLALQLSFLLLMAVTCVAQRASVSVNADSGLPRDPRPFGKYLVEICTISYQNLPAAASAGTWELPRTVATVCRVPRNPEGRVSPLAIPQDQGISIKLACDPAAKGDCNPTNPSVGADFFVSATADSGLPVQQTVVQGDATPLGGSGTVHYRANTPGPLIIRASAPASGQYLAAPPVELILQISGDPDDSDSCPLLPSAIGTKTSLLDASAIVPLLGNPTPFILVAQGSRTIFVYSTRKIVPGNANETNILASFQDQISDLAARSVASLGVSSPGKPFTVELMIPHASALGDLATRIGGLNYSQFSVQDVGRGRVRITSPAPPDCSLWKAFLTDIREMAWSVISDPMSYKLYYLSSSDVATAFSGLAPAAAASTSAAPAAAAASAPAAPTSTATLSISQPPGTDIQVNSDTTPCVVAGLAFGNPTGCGATPASGGGSAAATPPAAAPPPQSPLAMASVAVAAGTGEQTPPDLLLYSDATPGDDAQIEERNRILAQLDLPRPEMILTAWVTQNSTSNPQAMGAFSNLVNGMVQDYDRQFEKVVLLGWQSVKQQSAVPGYFYEPFRSYIEDRFVADTLSESKGKTAQDLAQNFLDTSQAKLADPIDMPRTALGLCERGRYCLGYNRLFHPLKPALTDLLLAIIAAREPVEVANQAITAVEGPAPPALPIEANCNVDNLEFRRRCHAIWHNLDLDHITPPPQSPNCEEQDFRGVLGSLISVAEPRVHLRCFREKANLLLRSAPASAEDVPPFGVGLLRSAVADFLFSYKMSQQYPHEFSFYDLSHSAAALNNALGPLIDALNRDLWSYQMFVRADMQYRVEQLNAQNDGRCCVKRLFGIDKPSFFNDGLITVRTISGQPTSVSTTSQSFLNASTAPQLAALLNSISGGGSAASGGTTAAGASTTGLGTLGLISSALSNYQTTYAQIGRQLQFTATPRSLAAASSAEIAVTLNADDSSGSPAYVSSGTVDPTINTSRVASHDTTTRVRVDSIKLFEVSSFSAIVERAHSRFPLLPPFVEIPFIGTFAGIPLGAAKEFHSSSAIISAYVVPTASDIAYGLRYDVDLAVDGLNSGPCSFYAGTAGPDVTKPCVFRRMATWRDAAPNSIFEFNKSMVRCFSLQQATDGTPLDCRSLTFDSAIRRK